MHGLSIGGAVVTYAVEAGTLLSGGYGIYARHFRPRHEPTASVVLVHGMVVAGRGMLPLARELAGRGLSVHLPDLPGFGRSAKPRHALDVAGSAAVLGSWMTAAGLEGASLLGNSFGTQIAAALAGQHRDKVPSLILVAPTIDRRFRRGWTALLPAGRPGGGPQGGLLGRLQEQAARLLVAPTDPPQGLSLRRLVVCEYAAAGLSRVVSTYRHALRDDISAHIRRWHCPVLVLRGQHDRLVSEQWARSLAAAAPRGSYREVRGADHDAQFHLPASLADAAMDHLVLSAAPFPDRSE